jgi:small subunit ribosomal protein S16
MLRIRLSRTGKKRQPSYRVVVAEKEAKRDGRVVERIGHYNPLANPSEFQIDEARALHWLSVGAQPSDAVRILLNKQGTFDRLTRLHAGEPLDALVTEFTGVAPVVAAPAAKAAPIVEAAEPTVIEKVTDTASDVAAAVAAPVVAAVEKVEELAETGIDKIEDAIEAVLGADEEE